MYSARESTSTPHSMNTMRLGLPQLVAAYRPARRPVVPAWGGERREERRGGERGRGGRGGKGRGMGGRGEVGEGDKERGRKGATGGRRGG